MQECRECKNNRKNKQILDEKNQISESYSC